jgi:hypothetical protein
MTESQGTFGRISIFEDFLGPDNDLTWGTGTVHVGQLGFVSVNEGSFEWTVDEPGGILAVTTDTGDDDNAALMAGTFKPADGGCVMEARFKVDSASLAAINCGFTETLSLTTPVMPFEYATATAAYNGSGGMVGMGYDPDATADDWRAFAGDRGIATGTLTRAYATLTADEWQIVRVEIDPNGDARCYVGSKGVGEKLKLVKSFTTPVTSTDVFYAFLMVENRSAAARVLEVDYFYVGANRDWTL